MLRSRVGALWIAFAVIAAPFARASAEEPAQKFEASDEAEATNSRLRGLMSKSALAKIDAAAHSLAADAVTKSATDVRKAANAWVLATWSNLGGDDLAALEFLVLMQAAKSATEDIEAIMEAVKAINQAKAQVEKRIAELEAAIAAKGRTAKATSKKKKRARPAPSKTPVGLDIWYAPKTPEVGASDAMTLAELDAAIEELRDTRDSLAELGEEQQLRVHAYAVRGGKLMAGLSEMLKKFSDVGARILSNLK